MAAFEDAVCGQEKAQEKLCFVISPIGDRDSPVRKHADMFLNAIVKQVLETPEFGYDVRRADEVAEPGMISDSIINDILSAHLAVADLTFHNPNVFYELGIRHAVQKPVIHFAQTGTPIPFDNIGYRAIIEDVLDWNGQENGRVQLRKAVQAIEGVDYRLSNPVTHARGTFELKKSADPQDQILANIVDRVRLLEENNKILIDLFDNVGPGRTSPRERLILESRSLRRWIEMEAESMSDDEKARMLARIRSVEHLIDLMG